jgi:WD40 repeat protein
MSASKAPKYKYLFGTPAQPTDNIGGIALGSVSPDSNVIKANRKFIAVPWKLTGTLAVIDASVKGALPEEIPLICQEDGINEFSFNPFLDNMIATASQDGSIKLWNVPDGGLTIDNTTPIANLVGHSKRLMFVDWHPLANNVLVSATSDEVKLWDVEAGQPNVELPKVHKGQVTSVTWNYDGSLLATAAKDKALRVFDPRGASVVAEGAAHGGVKGWRAVWLGARDRILSVGFTKTAEREISIWDARNLGKSLSTLKLDASPAAPMPFYDPDISVLYLASKGEGVIKLYEIADNDALSALTDFKSPQPAAGMAVLPKVGGVDVMKCEVARFLKLTAQGQIIRIRFEVPRSNLAIFHDDIYPDTFDGRPTGEARAWFAGETNPPHLTSMKPANV